MATIPNDTATNRPKRGVFFVGSSADASLGPQKLSSFWCLIVSLIAGVAFASSAGCHFVSNGQNAQGARLYEQGQYTAALQQFQKVILDDPQNADGYYNLAATTHRLASLRPDPDLIQRAEALYNQCLDHNPNHVECHRGLAVLLVDSRRADRAFALLKNWASQNPSFAEPRIELARLYQEHGQPQTALKYLEDAVQLNANSPRAWTALAQLREGGQDYQQALQNYQRALALNPGNRMLGERVAALSRELNASRDAIQNYNYSQGTQIAQPYGGTTRY